MVYMREGGRTGRAFDVRLWCVCVCCCPRAHRTLVEEAEADLNEPLTFLGVVAQVRSASSVLPFGGWGQKGGRVVIRLTAWPFECERDQRDRKLPPSAVVRRGEVVMKDTAHPAQSGPVPALLIFTN